MKYQKLPGKNHLRKKIFPWAYSVPHRRLFTALKTHGMNLNDIFSKRTEFGHILNETLDSGSLNVPRKTNLIKPELAQHSNSLSLANLFTNATQ